MKANPHWNANRVLRISICALVVLGQLAGTFAWAASATIAKRKGACGSRACGCVVADESARCCCDLPEPEPTPSCCKQKKPCCESKPKRSCCAKSGPAAPKASAAKVKSLLAHVMAQRCRGEIPPSAVAGDPEIPPSPPIAGPKLHEPAGWLPPSSEFLTTPSCDPPIPPPRLH